MTRNIACGIEYDGTGYRGFQRQPASHGATVQGELERAIEQIGKTFVVVHGSGRTDTGVHASGQVINFHTDARLTPMVWRRALNAVLPDTITVSWAREMPERFHARFSAERRSYRYTIWNHAAPSALQTRFSYHFPRRLNVDLMNEACRFLVGRKDFGAFGHSPDDSNPLKPGPHHCVRTIFVARCQRDEMQKERVYCDFTADAFLTGQVRRMVGTLLLVGQQRLSVEDFAVIVQQAQKTHPGTAAPPQGLCLVRVDYPEMFGVLNDEEDI